MLLRERDRSPATRRGVVLILVLGMLLLLAVIGVAFATFSGQAQYTARIYSQKLAQPDGDELMQYALDQLINDTGNVMSTLRGHSLKRDMYGNDAGNNGLLAAVPFTGQPLRATLVLPTTPATVPATFEVTTNIPQYLYDYDFTRWLLRVGSVDQGAATPPFRTVSQTFEVLFDSINDPLYAGQFRRLTVSGAHFAPSYTIPNPTAGFPDITIGLTGLVNNQQFELDGRFLRGFNGPGMQSLDLLPSVQDPGGVPGVAGRYANFRLSGGILSNQPDKVAPFDPSAVGQDEDYDAPDLDNWFMAVQSADGEVAIPSFHRPGILVHDPPNNYSDWALRPQDEAVGSARYRAAVRAVSKILRPRAVDHPAAGQATFPDLTARADGKIVYDVDNDGDTITDSVWVDLGHPVQRDASGRLYKPLFAFMVVGLNGRLPLNTAGNLNARSPFDLTADVVPFDVQIGESLFDHVSHLGYSPTEINPKYALQNAPFNLGVVPGDPPNNSQFDNIGVSVATTQLRNLLTGTREFDAALNGDQNEVMADGFPRPLPNNVVDLPAQGGTDQGTAASTYDVVPRRSKAVVGRWGDEAAIPENLAWRTGDIVPLAMKFINTSRAGRSPVTLFDGAGEPQGLQYQVDGIDENFNGFDFNSEQFVLTDAAGALLLPVERMRRFVVPQDISGNGLVNRYDTLPPLPSAASPFPPLFGLGPDNRGRVSFFHHYRPPGVHQEDVDAGPAPAIYPLNLNRLNQTAGYESRRNPGGANAQYMGAMPFDRSNTAPAPNYVPDPADPPPGGLAQLPTALFDPTGATFIGTFSVAGQPNLTAPNTDGIVSSTVRPIRGFPNGSLAFKDADEMNLYRPSPYDAPFGPEDLEWLYRRDDVDGQSLTSRLEKLAPISFNHPKEGQIRRRLFALDSWDRNNFTWAHDNPNGVAFTGNSRFPTLIDYASVPLGADARAGGDQTLTNASLFALENLARPPAPVPFPRGAVTVGLNTFLPTPAIAHGDRRINLNFPLPHSYDPAEPVRQKWVLETYELMKRVLPPQAVDTPQEVAALSQFVLNIVDFRDPDNAITIFTNPDVRMLPARRVPANPPPGDQFLPPSIHLELLPDNSTDPDYANPAAVALEQYGMEYQPVAINEVLGFQANYSSPDLATPDRNARRNRLVIELVNTLTKDASPDPANPSNLDLRGWEFVLLREADQATDTFSPTVASHNPAFVRPDPINGQIPVVLETGPNPVVKPVVEHVSVTTGKLTSNMAAPAVVPAIEAIDDEDDDEHYLTIGGHRFERTVPDDADIFERGIPQDYRFDGSTPANTWDLIPQILDPAFAAAPGGRYFWLYLLRPANPLDPTSKKVVVDSMRFPFVRSNGRGTTSAMGTGPVLDRTAVAPTNDIYSVGRMQPFRGGQIVDDPNVDDVNIPGPLEPDYTYGYSEQARPSANSGGSDFAYYNDDNPTIDNESGDPNEPPQMTRDIRHSLNAENNPNDLAWDYPVFHDRDFSSVAELLLVPGCPPGLFTKRFAEAAPEIPTPDPLVFPAAPATTRPPVNTPGFGQPFVLDTAHVSPYLPDAFYYTGAATATAPPAQVGGPTGAGWHRMLEFFEVPTPSLGAIGPVAEGRNFDWAREDRRPGQLNLNLIIDQEVFLGLIDDPRLFNEYGALPVPTSLVAGAAVPRVVTQLDANGAPSGYHPMSDLAKYLNGRGSTYHLRGGVLSYLNPDSGDVEQSGMIGAFADFLKLRHGGSGFLYAYGSGPVGTPYRDTGTVDPRVARDRWYHSLSYPDVNYTVMRPATLPPSMYTVAEAGDPLDLIDPGQRNGDFPPAPGAGAPPPPPVPPIPPRRLFQIPDVGGTGTPPSNASMAGQFPDPNPRRPYRPVQSVNPANTVYDPANIGPPVSYGPINVFGPGNYPSLVQNVGWHLGGADLTGLTPAPDPANDLRRHPYWRTEWLQKVMNLTTVRTHQYAAWVTVGFFEVVRPGNPTQFIPDQLGPELDKAIGKNQRFRSFFMIDRTRAQGYNPANPGDFREMVLYSRRIQ